MQARWFDDVWGSGFSVYYRALIITYAILEVPHYDYSILGSKTLF